MFFESSKYWLWAFGVMALMFLIRKVKRKANINKMNFNGKVVWITGASSGIGEALCYKFNELGAKLIITSRREAELERVKNNCKYPSNVEIFILDMADLDQLEIRVKEYISKNPQHKIDILINNAGLSMRASCLEHTFQKDKYIMNVNFLSVVCLTKLVLTHMLQFKSGHLVAVSSVQGKIGIANRSTYAASKHAIIGYFDSMRAEYGKDISVTVICPGYVRTNLDSNASYFDEKNKETHKKEKGMTVDKFSQIAVEGIYNKENEMIIDDDILSRLAVFFRNLWKDLVFAIIARKTKKHGP